MGCYYLYHHPTVTTTLAGQYKISSALRIRKHHHIHVILTITANKNKYVPLATKVTTTITSRSLKFYLCSLVSPTYTYKILLVYMSFAVTPSIILKSVYTQEFSDLCMPQVINDKNPPPSKLRCIKEK